MSETLAWVEDNDASYDEGAVHFLTTYKDVWGRGLTMLREINFPHCCSKLHGQGHPKRCP